MNNIEFVIPSEIEKRSFQIITEELNNKGIVLDKDTEDITKRVIHTSADFDYATTMRYSKDAVKVARELIKNGADIVTDTNMAKAGVNKKKLREYGGNIHCFMADEKVAREAAKRGVTRATVSMEYAAKIDKPVIFAIGNAPTALMELCDLIRKGKAKPVGIIAAPVGFVHVKESKHMVKPFKNIPKIIVDRCEHTFHSSLNFFD